MYRDFLSIVAEWHHHRTISPPSTTCGVRRAISWLSTGSDY